MVNCKSKNFKDSNLNLPMKYQENMASKQKSYDIRVLACAWREPRFGSDDTTGKGELRYKIPNFLQKAHKSSKFNQC